jgi:hypothetical protein
LAHPNQELQAILRALLAEIQHLRVDCARLEVRVCGNPSALELREIENATKTKIVTEHKALIAKIEAL